MSELDKLALLEKLLKLKKSKSFYAEKLNISELEVNDLLKKLRGKEDEFKDLEDLTVNVNCEKGTIESKIELNFEPKSVEELAKLHKIDLNKYKISNYWSKLKPNGKFTSSVFATLKKPKDYTLEDFTKFLVNFKPQAFNNSKKPLSLKDHVDVSLNLADFHLAKKTIQGDNLESKHYDYAITVETLIERVKANYEIDKVVFPISNDFFHTDTYNNTTTNGTPLDVTASFDQEYEKGFEILVNTINYLLTQAEEVEVILVQGNHDRTKGFYVAHALEVYFSEYENVKFQRHHSVTKSVVLGNTFIGYHHGNCKIDELPLLFATGKDSEAFGKALYREIHTGDKHHYMAKEVKGVRIQQMPSLSGEDRWHIDNNYVNNIKSGLAIVYDRVLGKIAEFESRI